MLARRLAAEVEQELLQLLRLADEFRSAPEASDTVSLRARASMLHDFYTGVERVLVRIAEELNGGVPRGEQWHRQLLQDMALEVRGVRPAVISSDLAGTLSEYLRFRHVFRHVYGFVLDAERMEPLEQRFQSVLDRFLAETRAFSSWMVGEGEG